MMKEADERYPIGSVVMSKPPRDAPGDWKFMDGVENADGSGIDMTMLGGPYEGLRLYERVA